MIKIFKILAVTVLASLGTSLVAQAVPTSASQVSVNFAGTPVDAVNYKELFAAAAVVKAVKGLVISNTATTGVYVSVGAAGSEAKQILVPATTSYPVYFPMTISQNQRIAIVSSTGFITTGVFIMDLLYN